MVASKCTVIGQSRCRPLLSASIPVMTMAIVSFLKMATPCFGIDTPQPPAMDDTPLSPLLRGALFSSEMEEITLTYDVSDDCGLDADAVMNEEGNTLKEGLIAATTAIAIGILEEKFGGGEENDAIDRGAYYTDEHPVTIDRILDITTNCAAGQNCLLLISTVSVVETDGNVDAGAVREAIVSGMQKSFKDGRFLGAIPEGTVICPEAASSADVSHLALAWSPPNRE